MIPGMTQAERRTATVPLAGTDYEVKELTDAQIMHMGRYARILMRDGIATMDKLEAMDKMFEIVHSVILDQSLVEALIKQEEKGEVELTDLIAFSRVFTGNPEEAPPAVVKRPRGRPRKAA